MGEDDHFDPVKHWAHVNHSSERLKVQKHRGPFKSRPSRKTFEESTAVDKTLHLVTLSSSRKYYLSSRECRRLGISGAGYVALAFISKMILKGWTIRVIETSTSQDHSVETYQKVLFYLARTIKSEKALLELILLAKARSE